MDYNPASSFVTLRTIQKLKSAMWLTKTFVNYILMKKTDTKHPFGEAFVMALI